MIHKHKFQALDGIRGFAAVMVFFYHYSLELFDPLALYAHFYVFRVSYAFVDFFFVLSGFVIASNYLGKINSMRAFKDFSLKRLIRLYPLLFATVMVFVVLKLYAFLFTDFNFNSESYSLEVLFIETIEPLTFMNSTPIITSKNGMNPVSWSISAEMIAYMLFAVFCFFLPRKKWPFVVSILLGVVFMIYQERYLYTGDFGFVRGFINFSSGVLIFHLYSKVKTNVNLTKVLEGVFIFLVLATLALIAFNDNELWNLLLPITFSLGVYVFAQEQGLLSKILKTKVMQFLGKISYSFYLNHFIVLWVYYQVVWKVLKLSPSPIVSFVGGIVVLFFVIIVSSFTYKWVELFWSRKLKNKFRYS